jgi:ribonuclease G
MANNTLVINCDLRETRVALIENGIIAELHIERAAARGTVGNIVLGRVTRVLPGMQAAFIDVGMERAAFLHVEDLIRPDDFEAYLSGRARDGDEEPSGKGEGGRRVFTGQGDDVEFKSAPARAQPIAAEAALAGDDDDDQEILVSATKEAEADDAEADDVDDSDVEDDDSEDDVEEDDDSEDDVEEDDEAAEEQDGDDGDDDDSEDDVEEEEEQEEEDDEREEASFGDDAAFSEPAPFSAEAAPTSASDAASAAPAREPRGAQADGAARNGSTTAAAPNARGARKRAEEGSEAGADDEANRKRRRRRRRRGRGTGDAVAEPSAPAPVKAREAREPREARRAAPRREARSARERGGKRGAVSSSRVARSVPITEVVREGDEVIVQISKEPIGTKGARVTSHVSLPGRYAVYLPTVEHVGISKRIGSPRERQRLRAVIETLKPQTGGLIVRTVAEGLTKKALKADIGYLIKLWAEISRKHDTAKAPSILYGELDLVLKTARDLFTDEIDKIVIDDKDQHARLVRFVEMFLPERVKDIELYAGDEPIFDAYGIEDEISRALSRKVPLPSGGYLIIDQAEALTAIDVNTGRYVGKGSKDLEETALKTNLEAVTEIAYQLRFRNIGGLVILDLIDMEHAGNRDKVWRALEQALAKDKAKTTLNRISELGLIEMTRKRTRESLSRLLHEPCFYCDGTGQIQSRTTIGYEILRQIRRERHTLPGYVVLVNAHPAVVDLMTGEEKAAVAEAERRYMRRIEFNARREYHIEQFDLQGK